MYKKSISEKTLRVAMLLVLLTIGAPATTHGQTPWPDAEAAGFLETRIHEPGHFSQYPNTIQTRAATAPQDLPQWHIETVNDVKGTHPSLALDAEGYPHMTSINPYGLLHYSYRDSSGWHVQTIGNGIIGRSNSLALDSANHPCISYFASDSKKLQYAYYDGVTWQITAIDDGGYYESHSSLALDSLDRPHISYGDHNTSDLKYAYYDGATWHIDTVDSAGLTGDYSALALDSADRPHITYYDTTNSLTKYAYYDGSSWNIDVIDKVDPLDFAGDTSIELDTADRPHVTYYGNQDLKYAYYDGSSWRTEMIDHNLPYRYSASLALDVKGRPHISYWGDGLKYTYYTGSSWQSQVVDVSSNSSLVLDSVDRPHIAYGSGSQLKYAVQLIDPTDWSKLTYASYRDMNFEVYTAQGDGTFSVRRTNHAATDTTPDFNRGATQITFVSTRDGNSEIYKMNANGSGQTRLTQNGASDSLPTWSPDSSQIAFYSNRDGNSEIYVMNADGSSQTRLTNHSAWDGHPAWSPDGSKIAFASDRSGQYQIWTMNADGSNQQPLSPGLSAAAYPDWSPDGRRIAFSDDANGDGWLDIAVINTDGSGLTHPLGNSPSLYDYLAPVWAPGGMYLAFTKVQWIQYQGDWYWVDAYINYTPNLDPNSIQILIGSSYDWWLDWETTDIAPPVSTVTAPAYSGAVTFTVQWSGNDAGLAGLRSYDVQYRDGLTDGWTDWLLDTPQIAAVFTGQGGHTYYFRCRARDHAFNLEPYPGGDGDARTMVDLIPPTSAASSPEYATQIPFLVSWSGNDGDSGIASYDVQYRDGHAGVWTDWLTGTTATQAAFDGQLGHTYYFQARARDMVGNQEAYPGDDGDTLTHAPQYALSGHILGNREQPVALAIAQATPQALNNDTARSGASGGFALYFNQTGTYTVTASRGGFGTLPPMKEVPVGTTSVSPTLYLPPSDDHIVDGGFEANDLVAWHPTGDITPTTVITAHTGSSAAALGGQAPTGSPSTGPWRSVLEQNIALSPTLESATLSLLYQVASTEPNSNTLQVSLVGPTQTVTYTLPLTQSGWIHRWWDISAWAALTLTLKLEWSQSESDQPIGVIVDEVSLGSAVTGSYPLYLPLVSRYGP